MLLIAYLGSENLHSGDKLGVMPTNFGGAWGSIVVKALRH